MTRWLLAAAIAAAIIAAGCGSHRPVSSHPATAFVCHHKQPAQLGECIQQELGHVKPARPPLTQASGVRRPQCIDISRWQPHPRFRQLRAEGIVCVIVQGADNTHQSNPFFDGQVQAAHEAGMAVGVYVFAEGGLSLYQANALIAASIPERSRITLGAWVDAEVPSAYSHTCEIVAHLTSAFPIVGVYGSPGTYRGGRCGLQWPAEWGSGPAYPLPGYPASTIKFRQWCGTCVMGGNDGQIDRDEDLGLMALAAPKAKPSVATLHAALAAAIGRRQLERAFLTRHHCRQPPWHVAVDRAGRPSGHWEHSCHVELRHGRSTNRHIGLLRREGAR